MYLQFKRPFKNLFWFIIAYTRRQKRWNEYDYIVLNQPSTVEILWPFSTRHRGGKKINKYTRVGDETKYIYYLCNVRKNIFHYTRLRETFFFSVSNAKIDNSHLQRWPFFLSLRPLYATIHEYYSLHIIMMCFSPFSARISWHVHDSYYSCSINEKRFFT